MQHQVSRRSEASPSSIAGPDERCPQCGEAIDGIEATGSGHRFVGCGHTASTRVLPGSAEGPVFAGVTID